MKLLKSKILIMVVLLILFVAGGNIYCNLTVFHNVTALKKDITDVIDINKTRTQKDYALIYEQTGVAPALAKQIIESGSSPKLLELQSHLFEPKDYEREYIFFPTTAEERSKSKTPIVPLKNRDILITFNTHTLFWRHGHCAIVTDADNGEVLEHRSIGNVSSFGYSSYWGTYPAFVILRHDDAKKAEMAAKYAKDSLVGIDYNLFAGVLKKDKSDEDKPSSSQCSHIVWQAFKSVGVDIDSDGGFLVTPHDVAMSDELSVIQLFGLDGDDFSDRVLK
ncbi:MAG: hypothetical protein E7395_07970 [Ruminococcaceae bacterium]|nr:hypothetical protein [Oscillospiraceae bacterium]